MSAVSKALKFSWLSVLLFIGLGNIYGQASLNLDYVNPSEIVICGDEVEFEIEVRNITTSTVTGITVDVDLPSGVKYVVSSLSGSNVSENNVSNLNVPVFSVNDIPITKAVTFKISIEADCDLSNLVNNGGLATIKLTSDYSGGSLSISTKPLSVREPSLNIKDITNRFATVDLGDTIVRKITLYNTGQGGAHKFLFTQVNQNGMKVIGTSGGSITISKDTIRSVFDSTHFKLTGNKDAVLDLNETVVIYDTIVVLTCDRLKSTYRLEWGCGGKLCDVVTSSANLTVSTRAPKLSIRVTDGKTPCLDASNLSTNGLRVINTGNDTARTFEMNIFNSYNGGYYSRILTEIVVSSIKYRKGASGSWTASVPVGVEIVDTSGTFACLSSYPVGGVTLNLPDLAPGDTMFIEWDSRSCCIDACGPAFYSHRWRYLPSYYDQCKTKIIDAEVWGSGGYIQSFSMSSSTPSDVLDGENAKFIFTVSNGYLMGISSKSRMDARFILPSGFSHSLNVNDFAYYNLNGGAWKPESVTQKGDTIYARFSGSPTTTLNLSELIIRVSGKCNSSADHGTGSYQMDLYYNPDTSCSTGCFLNIYCGSGNVKLHCNPKCAGGMAFRSFTAERISIGKPDNDNDGLPDASGTIDLDKIKTERVVYRDTLLTTFRGKILAAGSVKNWRYGKAKSIIPYGRYLKVADARVKIYRSGSLLYNCGNVSYTTSLSGNTRTIEFDFGIPALISSGCPLYSGFQYFAGDSINVEVYYVVDPNPGNFIQEITSTNEFYMSTVASPSSSQKYQCDTFSGRFVLAGTYFTNCCTNNWYTNSCDVLTVSNNFYLSIGNCCSNYAGGNFFPFEYRPWAKLSKVMVIPPSGFSHVYSDMYQYRTAGSAVTKVEFQDTAALSATSASGDTLFYDVANYYKDRSGPLNISDDGFTGVFRTRYIPTCKAGQGSSPMRYIFVFERKGTFGTGYDTIEGANAIDNVFFNKPELKITAQEIDVKAYSDTVEWRLRISNNSTFSDAEYIWVGAINNGNVRVIEAIDLTDNSTIPLTADFLPLGNLVKQGTKDIILRAVYVNCNTDSIELLFGSNCVGYPDSIAAYPCITTKLMLKYTPVNTRLDVSLLDVPAEVNLCEPVSYSMKIINTGRSRVYDLYVDLIMRTGMVLGDTAWLRLEGSTDSVMVTGKSSPKAGVVRWDLAGAHTGLKKDGMGGINDNVSTVYFTFNLETDCDFASSSYLLMKPGGTLKCGNPVNAAFEIGDPINIKGVTKPYFAAMSFEIDPLEVCRFGGRASFKFLNLGPDTTKVNDRIQLIVPDGLYIDSLVADAKHNAPAFFSNIIQATGGKTIEWILPSGITAGDSSVFDISVYLVAEELPCEGVQIFAQSVVKQPALCVKDSTWCDINVVTADDLKLDSIIKSQYELSFVKGQSLPSSTKELVTLDYLIRNSGSAKDSGQVVKVLVVYDKNGNGYFDLSESVIYIDSISDRIDLTSVARSIAFSTSPEESCRLLLVIDSTNCVCSPSFLKIPPLPLRNAGNDTTICSFEEVQIGNPGIAGNSYLWSPKKGILMPDSARTLFSTGNAGFKDSIYQLVLLTDKGQCKTRDTVNVTVRPQMVTNFSKFRNLCRGDSTIIGNIVTGGTGFKSYQWSPATGVNNPTKVRTFVKPTTDVTYTLTVLDAIGCRHTDSTRIDVLDIPVAALSKQDTCAGELFVFSDQSTYVNSQFDSIRWEITGLDTAYNRANWIKIIDSAGSYPLHLFVQDSFGCKDETSEIITIYPNPIPKMNIHDDCQWDTTLLIDLTTINSGSYEQKWVVLNDTFSGSAPVVIMPQKGLISVELITVSDKGCERSVKENMLVYEKPVTALLDSDICLFDSISMQPTVIGDSIAYTEWDADGMISTGKDWNYRSTDTGIRNITVVTTTKYGCSDTASAILDVHPLPVAGIYTEPVCEGDSIILEDVSVISEGLILEHWWNTGGSYYQGNKKTGELYPTYGYYPVSLAVKSDYGCTDTVDSQAIVHYLPEPVLRVTGNCAQDMITLEHVESMPDSIRSVAWSINGTGQGTGTTIKHVFNTNGDHTIDMMITSNAGCVSDSSFTIHVDPKPVAGLDWVLPCKDDLVSFKDMSTTAEGTITNWLWTLHDNSSRNTPDFSHNYGVSGNFNIRLEVANNFNCKDTIEQTVTTNPVVAPSFTIDDVCADVETRVRNTSTNLNAPISSIWFYMGNGDTVKGKEDFFYTYPRGQAGTHNLTMWFETGPGCYYTTNGNVDIFPLPTASFTASPVETDILNSDIVFKDLSAGSSGVTYEISDGAFYSSRNFSHRFTDSGTYWITQVATTDEGCADTFTSSVRVNFIYTFFMPNTVTPNGDGINDVFRPTGYGIVKYEMFIFNRWGELLFRSANERDEWDPGDIMAGVYFYQINVIDHENMPHAYTGSIHVIR